MSNELDETKVPTPGGNPAKWKHALILADGRQIAIAAKPEHLEAMRQDYPGSTIGARRPTKPEPLVERIERRRRRFPCG